MISTIVSNIDSHKSCELDRTPAFFLNKRTTGLAPVLYKHYPICFVVSFFQLLRNRLLFSRILLKNLILKTIDPIVANFQETLINTEWSKHFTSHDLPSNKLYDFYLSTSTAVFFRVITERNCQS